MSEQPGSEQPKKPDPHEDQPSGERSENERSENGRPEGERLEADARPDDTHSREPGHDRRMLEALVCPLTQTTLSYDAESGELISRAARLAFPVRAGIPIMLVSEARDLD